MSDAFSRREGVVAHTEFLSLHRDTLAHILVGGKRVPSERTMVEGWAFRWIEFALLVERLARSDSMLDSATVVRAMWTDANQMLVDEYHEQLAAELVQVDSVAVDSAYAAGDHRLIYHILVRTAPDMSPPARAAARREAEAIRDRLAAGGSWEVENEANDDPVARRAGGSLGLIERGQTVQPFESVAFQLAPGELSDVVETPFGYHVLRRPDLEDVRDTFDFEITDVLTARMDSTVLREVAERANVKISADAPGLMREAVAAPLRAYQAPKVIGRFRGGTFTTADFVRWMQALSGEMYMMVPGANDDQLTVLLESLIRNELLIREAREAGMTLAVDSLQALRTRLRVEIDRVRSVTGMDSAMAGLADPHARRAAGEAALRVYFRNVAAGSATVVSVPPFLSQTLRETMDWSVSQSAVDATLERIVRLRQEQLEPSGVPPIPSPNETADDSLGDSDDAS